VLRVPVGGGVVGGTDGEHLHVAFPPSLSLGGEEREEAEGEGEGVDVGVLEGGRGVEVEGVTGSKTGEGDGGGGVVEVLHFGESSSAAAAAAAAAIVLRSVSWRLLPLQLLLLSRLGLGLHPYDNSMGLF